MEASTGRRLIPDQRSTQRRSVAYTVVVSVRHQNGQRGLRRHTGRDMGGRANYTETYYGVYPADSARSLVRGRVGRAGTTASGGKRGRTDGVGERPGATGRLRLRG